MFAGQATTNKVVTDKVITIKNTQSMAIIMQECKEVAGQEVIKEKGVSKVSPIVDDLKEQLTHKIPGTANREHKTPAYLAANQIGHEKRVVLLYLPEEKERIVMLNPTYEVLKYPEGPAKHRISSFFIDQVRVTSLNYAEELRVQFYDENWNIQTRVLKDLDAIAAQMGINLVFGITPLDHGITKEQLEKFAKGEEIAEIVLKDAKNRDQIQFIPEFIKQRKQHPLKYDFCTRKVAPQEQEAKANKITLAPTA